MSATDAQTPPAPLHHRPGQGLSLPPTLAQRLWRWGAPAMVVSLVLAALLGGLAAQRQGINQADAALETARLARYLGHLAQLSDSQALTVLGQGADLQHMALRVHDADQRLLLDRGKPTPATAPSVAWTVPRADGRPWTVTLTPVADTPWTRELVAGAVAAGVLALLLSGVVGMLALALRGAWRPLLDLQAALREVPRHGPAVLARLPAQPLREPESLAAALRQLAGTLLRSEQLRQHRMQRALLARERELQGLALLLQDGLGQRLSALRVDLTWLYRRLQGNPTLVPVLDQTSARIADVQRTVRDLTEMLDPLALRAGADDRHGDSPDLLADRLQALSDRYSRGGSHPLQCRVDIDLGADVAAPVCAALQLVLLRLSESALQLAALDRAATSAAVALRVDARAGHLLWTAHDDGQGALVPQPQETAAADLLARLHVAAWAWGAELEHGSGPQGRGRQLTVRLPLAQPPCH